MILQSIPDISPLNPISAIVPFVFVISVSMIREGCEDCKRGRADKRDNSSPYMVLNSEGVFAVKTSKDLKVGDILKLAPD